MRRLDRERHIAEQLTCAFGREGPVVREDVDFIFRGLIGFREMRRNNPQKRALNTKYNPTRSNLTPMNAFGLGAINVGYRTVRDQRLDGS